MEARVNSWYDKGQHARDPLLSRSALADVGSMKIRKQRMRRTRRSQTVPSGWSIRGSRSRSSGRNGVAFAGSQEEVGLQPVLTRIEVVIAATERKQLGMTAALHDSSLLDDQDLVGAPDRREPVGDNKRRASLH